MDKLKVNFLRICDHAFFTKEDKLSIIGIFDRVYLSEVPGILLKASVVADISVVNESLSELKIKLQILDSKNSSIFSTPELSSKILPVGNKKGKIGLVIDIGNLKFNDTGMHKVVLEANEKIIAKLDLLVKKQGE